jgi:hypothetical protein
MPLDLAPAGGRTISVGATPTPYVDWVGVADSDAYTFWAATSGTLRLDFSELTDTLSLQLIEMPAGGGSPSITALANIGNAINNPYASRSDVLAGSTAAFNLTSGSYQIVISAPTNPPYTSPYGNTGYQMAVSFQ